MTVMAVARMIKTTTTIVTAMTTRACLGLLVALEPVHLDLLFELEGLLEVYLLLDRGEAEQQRQKELESPPLMTPSLRVFPPPPDNDSSRGSFPLQERLAGNLRLVREREGAGGLELPEAEDNFRVDWPPLRSRPFATRNLDSFFSP